jgi:hypothetical protein
MSWFTEATWVIKWNRYTKDHHNSYGWSRNTAGAIEWITTFDNPVIMNCMPIKATSNPRIRIASAGGIALNPIPAHPYGGTTDD